ATHQEPASREGMPMSIAIKVLAASLVLSLTLLGASPLAAVVYQWNVASGDWDSTGNWYPNNILPSNNDTAWIHNGGTAGYHAGYGYTISILNVEGTGSGQNSHMEQDGGTLTASNYIYIPVP
ncbi:MAG: hypothetical protein MUO24_09355, partial [Desulfobacterales bacterium]|nr:hypothetical protein [Desulfobacterales bacterium]